MDMIFVKCLTFLTATLSLCVFLTSNTYSSTKYGRYSIYAESKHGQWDVYVDANTAVMGTKSNMGSWLIYQCSMDGEFDCYLTYKPRLGIYKTSGDLSFLFKRNKYLLPAVIDNSKGAAYTIADGKLLGDIVLGNDVTVSLLDIDTGNSLNWDSFSLDGSKNALEALMNAAVMGQIINEETQNNSGNIQQSEWN